MRFQLLGPLEVRTETGTAVKVGGPNSRRLLAALLLAANDVVPADRLVDVVWETRPPVSARGNLQTYVWNLRRVLAWPGSPPRLVTGPGGYLLHTEQNELDRDRFQALASRGRELLAEDPIQARSFLRAALAQWHGPALADLAAGSTGLHTAAAQLDEQRLEVWEDCIEAEHAAGRPAETVAELVGLTLAHPWRENLYRLYMLALYRCGRQADALAAFRRLTSQLRDELGIDPSPRLTALHHSILRGDPALDLAAGARPTLLAARSAGPGRHPSVPRQLPAPPRQFTGRTDQLKLLNGFLDDAANTGGTVVISAIGGTAGIGKTALAVRFAHQVAARFPDGQLYVNLRGFDPSGSPATPAEALRGFLDALGAAPERIPASLPGQAALYRSLLADQRVLVLLDNARDADQVRLLLPGSPGCLVLVTSRSQLTGLTAVEGARPLTLDVLSEDEATDMLASRLGAERLAGEPGAASELVDLCARLPLALAIVAARAAAHPGPALGALTAELRDARGRLDALATGEAATDVRAVFSWSYQQLSGPAARLFRLLGIHPGPDISAPAAASLAGIPPDETRAALKELTRAHLLTEYTAGRHTFHDLLRAYATEQASTNDSSDHRRAALHRVLDHYLHTAHAAALLLHPAREAIELSPPRPGTVPESFASHGQALAWLEAEYRVLLAAVAQAVDAGFDSHGWQLPWTLANFLDRRGQWDDLLGTQRTALATAERLGDHVGQAYAHRLLGRAHARLRCYEAARTHLGRARDLFRQLGDKEGEANVYLVLAVVSERQGHHDEALGYAKESLRLFRAVGQRVAQGTAENAVGWYFACLGDHQQALRHCQRALRLHRESGNRDGEPTAWDSLGYAYHRLGDFAQAADCYQQALGTYHELPDLYDRAATLIHLGDARQAMGNLHSALAAWQQALAILDDLGHPGAAQVRAKLAAAEPGQFHAGPGHVEAAAKS